MVMEMHVKELLIFLREKNIGLGLLKISKYLDFT